MDNTPQSGGEGLAYRDRRPLRWVPLQNAQME